MIETFLLSTQILKGEIPVINISASGTNFSPVLKSPLAPISFVDCEIMILHLHFQVLQMATKQRAYIESLLSLAIANRESLVAIAWSGRRVLLLGTPAV